MTSKIKVNFLGTGAQIPTVKRNHSGILITRNEENILVDCGEGIQRQFRIAKLNPCKVTRILITHKHADHILGLPGLLSTMGFSEYNKTLYIYGPKGIKNFMSKFFDLFKIDQKFKVEVKEVSGKFFDGGDFYLEAERMEHGIPTNAYSFVVKDKLRVDKKKLKKSGLPHGKLLKDLSEGKDVVYDKKKFKSKDLTYLENGKKISVVLDTAMNSRIEKFVKGADLLVIESSFGSDLKQQAKDHLHLTAEQCGMIAKKAKVGELVLTHISQRYELNLKFLLEDAKKNFKKVKVANDFDVLEV